MKYIIALIVSIIVYHYFYKWLDKNEWFNNQFERNENERCKFQDRN